jgi:hypothetical protein
MAIYDLFSKRQKKLRGELPDVYQYDDFNKSFRIQVIHIVKDAFGTDVYGSRILNIYEGIHKTLCKEYGVFSLNQQSYVVSASEAIFDYFLNTDDYEHVLDIIELTFKTINIEMRKISFLVHVQKIEISPDEAIAELNCRFKEHGIGYQFESNELIRIDSQILHSEVVKPVLKLLSNEAQFQGANEEFLSAHSHFRHGRYKECLVDTLKAFESVMKTICKKRKWTYGAKDTAKKLIQICFENGLIPVYLQSQFSSLRSLLETGVPTLRNKLGGHGQGDIAIKVPETVASYAIHLTATNILFLIGMEKKLR